ncbi:MAG: LacI family DNA-binding transcriptional regulator [Candidatus Marinimicrobia bacterium]|nr:LacI family DNA-binding transcriptional regulator [Candidatus Neomarinimicrobiota bacterium]
MSTIKDVAKKAGVSISTVSLVINGKGYVAPETREKIMSTIQELNYKPLHSARKLATKMTGNIGYIVWDVHFSEVEIFYSQIFLGMEYAARDSEHYILLTTVKEDFNPKTDLPRFLKYRDVDGVVLAGRVPHNLIKYLEDQNMPFVIVDYGIPGKVYNSIVIDNFNGAFQAIDQLIKSGKKKIGFVGGSFYHPSIKERYRGYKEALEAHGIGNIEYFNNYSFIKEEETSPEIGQNGINQLLKNNENLDAVFCCNDTTAIGVMNELKAQNKSIPKDIAVVGFDDITSSSFCSPALSTVRVPKLDIGKQAYKLITEIIYHPKETPQTRTISVEYIKRKSS